jgi:hypothetical protein
MCALMFDWMGVTKATWVSAKEVWDLFVVDLFVVYLFVFDTFLYHWILTITSV